MIQYQHYFTCLLEATNTLYRSRKIISRRDLARSSKDDLGEGIVRVIKGKESVGYFIPEDEIELFAERLEVTQNASWEEWEQLQESKSSNNGKDFLQKLAA